MFTILDFPKEIILHIASFIEREYLNQDLLDDLEDEIDSKEHQNLKELFKENGNDGCYYPLRNLYATCSSFSYLKELEYICIDEGEFHSNIVSKNINGINCGMRYNGNISTGILGYTIYDKGNMINENSMGTNTHFNYRQIDGILYFEYEDCERWWNSCTNTCKNCIQLNKIQKEIFEKDPFIEKIFKENYYDCKVIIRTRKSIESSLILDYDKKDLVLYQE